MKTRICKSCNYEACHTSLQFTISMHSRRHSMHEKGFGLKSLTKSSVTHDAYRQIIAFHNDPISCKLGLIISHSNPESQFQMKNLQKAIQNECFSTKVDDDDEVEELLLQGLEKKSLLGWSLYKYKGHWCSLDLLRPIIRCEKYFKARDTDVILATLPKSGTTWLKALTFSIINRSQYPLDENPLLTSNPHALIPFLERNIYRESENPDLDPIPDPRIFSTHVHYKLLPISIMESKCRVVHICRNPLDQFISLWHFKNLISTGGSISLDEFLEAYCEGTHDYGPFWEHVLGYWNAYLKNPKKVLFLKYEDLKKDVNFNVKTIAEFVGYPFSLEEEKMGLIDKIVKLCSFEKLKNLEVNQVGSLDSSLKNSYFFRNGEIGDWVNYLTPAMVERIEKVVREEFRGSGLMF